MQLPNIPGLTLELHDVLERLVLENSPTTIEWLVTSSRRELRDTHIDEHVVTVAVETTNMLVHRPDGSVVHLLDMLDGIILTQRVRAPLAGRNDLWATVALQPLLNVLAETPLPVAGMEGMVSRAASGHDALVGPPGWLPAVPRYGVVGIRVQNRRIRAEPVDEATLPELATQQRIRDLVDRHFRRERFWRDSDDLEERAADLVAALSLARLEDPDFLSEPAPPLDELLDGLLRNEGDLGPWDRPAVVTHTDDGVSFELGDVPDALYRELDQRASRYSMRLDRYVVAVLGHLAWRTPFAEDMEPWEGWDPHRRTAALHVLPSDPR